MYYFCAMKCISKIVIIFFALLISYINSGFLNDNAFQDSLTDTEESFPLLDDFSIQDKFICPVSDHNIYDPLSTGKTEKFLQKFKLQWSIKAITPTTKDNHFPLRSQDQNPSLVTWIYGPHDISFPFDYFW